MCLRNKKHNSAICKHKKEGHKSEATLENKIGGGNISFGATPTIVDEIRGQE